MKGTLSAITCLIIATLLIAIIPTDADAMIYEDTVRLHILADSDTEEAQAVKLKLRDEILMKYGKELSSFESASEASSEL